MIKLTFLKVFFLSFLFTLVTVRGKDLTDSVDALSSELMVALDSTSSGNTRLEANYIGALENLSKLLEKTGDSELVLKIRDEIKNYKAPGERDFSNIPQLEKLRAVYEKSRDKIDSDLKTSRLAVLKIYKDRFRLLKESLEEQGDVKLALKADRRINSIAKGIATPENIEDLMALWIFERHDDVESVKDAQIDRKDGKFVITSTVRAGSYIKSKQTFSVPFVMFTRVATDSVNIRYYLGNRIITILNWEVNPTQLRLHNPIPNSQPVGINERGWVKENELHDVQIFFRKDRITVEVNGEVRGEMKGDYSNLQGEAGIGPAFGSTLTLESFKVLPIQELNGDRPR